MNTLLPYDEAVAILKKELNDFSIDEVEFLDNSTSARFILELPELYKIILNVDSQKLISLFKEVTGKTLLITPF